MNNEPTYPVAFAIQREETQSRITNFPLGIGTFIRTILLIPHFIIVFFLSMVAIILYFLATFAILFTGKYPEGFYRFVETYLRWNANTTCYLISLYDAYPPFRGDQTADYPLTFTFEYPETSSRLLNLPLFIGMAIRALLLIPHFVIVYFLAIAEGILVFIAQFAILFTGSFPEGMHRFIVGVNRWSNRLTAYMLGMTDKYPPFSTS